MQIYTYRNRKTGRKVTSNKPLFHEDYILISRVADGQMKSARIRQK